MVKYKTVVTDYEGLQRILDESSESGWKLFSVQADTWRKVMGTVDDTDPLEAMGVRVGEASAHYSASYYLIILFREDGLDHQVASFGNSEELSFDDYSSGNY